MDRLLEAVSVVSGALAVTFIPVVLAIFNRRSKADKPAVDVAVEPKAMFGMAVTSENAIERGDRIANDYLLDLRMQRDEAKGEAKAAVEAAKAASHSQDELEQQIDELEARLIRANDRLRDNGLPIV
jgi:hypothetical protein